MGLPFHPAALLDRLRSTYWFIPAVMTTAALVLAVGLVEADHRYSDVTEWLGWAYGGGADGARSLLSAVAGSTMTVVSVTFSVMVVALTVSSQHFGPRLLNSFMRDSGAQAVLGTFTGTFAYCLMVLRTVQGEGDGYSIFVPHLAVTAALVLTLVSVGMLIYYVHHVATSMQVSEITAGVAHDLERTVNRLYPDPVGEGTEPPARHPPPVPKGALETTATHSGYLQETDAASLVTLAREHRTVIWLAARPGDFVVEGHRLAHAHPPPADGPAFQSGLRDAFIIGTDRTSAQDADFAVQQLVEVALRALSPGVNEPFTAITCIDRLGQGLSRLACRQLPGAVRTDEAGDARVVARPRTFVELLEAAFEPIARYAGQNPAIHERLLETLAMLGHLARRPEDLEAIRRVADFVWDLGAKEVKGDHSLARLARLHERVRLGFRP